jgi:hypothetical protein
MRWTPQRLAVLVSTIAAMSHGGGLQVLSAQIPSETGRAEREGLTVTCEVFCSSTTLGSSNARIRWSLSAAALGARGIQSLSAAKQTLDVTVFYKGFDKNLFVTLPISAQTPQRPIAALAQPGQAKLPAYQIQIVEIEQSKTPQTTDSAGSEMSAVIARLEPGVNYTWRVVVETSAGRLLSAPVTCQSATCPVDAPLKGKPQIKKP